MSIMEAGLQSGDVVANGVRLHVVRGRREGRPAILFLHGLYDRWEIWRPAMVALAPEYDLIAPDLRGHGRSDWPESGYRLSDYVDDAIGLLDRLAAREVAVIGHSLGAVVAALVAAKDTARVRAVVLEDPALEQNDGTTEWLEMLLDAKRGTPEETYALISEMRWDRDDADWRRETEWLRGTADGPFVAMLDRLDRDVDLFTALERITCPVLLLHADPAAGGALSESGAERARQALRDGVYQRFPDTGHSIHHERPAEFVEIVSDFLRRAVLPGG
ncbi:alpha/beta fold hydrolase [Nitrolancea hollandica]|nr:alpha/beta hydrolase [Nitrolancea hollandica]